jgi:hypothetical protein
MLKQIAPSPLGTRLLVGAESFLTDLSVEDESLISGGDRTDSPSRPRRRRPRRRRRRSRT